MNNGNRAPTLAAKHGIRRRGSTKTDNINRVTSNYETRGFPWQALVAVFFFFSALLAFELGVAVSERPDVVDSNLLVKAYYSLSLFVLGGTDLGVPVGGEPIPRTLLWLAYFGAPILTTSSLVGFLLRVIAPQSWLLRATRR